MGHNYHLSKQFNNVYINKNTPETTPGSNALQLPVQWPMYANEHPADRGGLALSDSDKSGVEAFGTWCEGLAASKARNAVPGEPAPPLVNAVTVPIEELIDAFQKAHPEFGHSRSDLEAFANDYGHGLEVNKERWDSLTNS